MDPRLRLNVEIYLCRTESLISTEKNPSEKVRAKIFLEKFFLFSISSLCEIKLCCDVFSNKIILANTRMELCHGESLLLLVLYRRRKTRMLKNTKRVGYEKYFASETGRANLTIL